MCIKRKMTRMSKGLRNRISSYFLLVPTQCLEGVRMVGGKRVSGRISELSSDMCVLSGEGTLSC